MKRPAKLLRLLTTGCAGLAAFLVAAQWSRSTGDAGAAVDIVQPALSQPISASASVSSSASDATLTPTPTLAADALLPQASSSRAVPTSSGQAFAKLSWLPPPPPPPPPAAALPPAKPAAPVAPPLPYSFVGMVEQGKDKPQAFLARGDTLLIVSAGDQLDNNIYRVDSFNASRVVITYVPMNIQQTIDLSGATK